jgi:riboflavin kinase / FMN adenylyltransferase
VYRWYGLDDVPEDWGRSVVTIGEFDGVHLGHQRVVGRAAEIARERGLPVVVITFDPHPDEVIRPGSHPPFLTTARRRAELLVGLGAEAVCVLPFTLDFSRLGPDEFVRIVLADRLHAAAVVVGDNFRFGHKAAGDVALLANLGEKYDFAAEGVPLLVLDGETISSTYIRERLAAGDVVAAAKGLGRPHRVEGIVVRGHQRGRALGFPTANLETPPHTAIPADGVYAGWLASLDADGRETDRWPAAISVGTNPTFGEGEQTVEAYALDRDDLDLYGARAAIDFATRLRGTVRFDSVDDLVRQMRDDVDQARALIASALPARPPLAPRPSLAPRRPPPRNVCLLAARRRAQSGHMPIWAARPSVAAGSPGLLWNPRALYRARIPRYP